MKKQSRIVQAILSIIVTIITFFTLSSPVLADASQADSPVLYIKHLYQMKIDATINPATLSHLQAVIKEAKLKPQSAIAVTINTPGGLVSVTKDMITAIGESNLPFIAIVGPEGASATSAGAILSAASHILLMYPGTNIGAATPINISSDMPKDGREKAINDLMALVSSLRQAREKKDIHFKEMVNSAKSFSAKDALEKSITDGIISGDDELIAFLDKKEIILNGKKTIIQVTNLKTIVIEMDLGQKVLNFLASPELAYLLFLLGAALIYFELQAPGGFVAGGLGAISLILAGISFQVIPLNFGGLGLILLSFALFTLEIYITSFGLLSLAGLAALVAGSLFLFRTNDAYFELSQGVIFSVTGAIVVFMGIISYVFMKSRKQLSSNFNDEIPSRGIVMGGPEEREGLYQYQIKIQGEIWKAFSTDKINVGETVAIEKKDEDNMAYIIKALN